MDYYICSHCKKIYEASEVIPNYRFVYEDQLYCLDCGHTLEKIDCEDMYRLILDLKSEVDMLRKEIHKTKKEIERELLIAFIKEHCLCAEFRKKGYKTPYNFVRNNYMKEFKDWLEIRKEKGVFETW